MPRSRSRSRPRCRERRVPPPRRPDALPGSDLAHAPAGTTSAPIALHRRLFARAPPASARPRPARSRGEGATTLASFATTQNDDESARPGPGTMGTVSDLIGQVATLDAASIGLPWPSRPDVAASVSSFQNVIGQAPARRSGRERPTAGRYQIRVSLPVIARFTNWLSFSKD